jgi:ubiquinone/menaquinone biosynthesis C-methylase UbiE
MPAAYDTYDYPSYWQHRDYEHEAEVSVIKYLLSKIAKIDTILDLGSGYGRLTPSYIFRGKKIIMTDPSAKLLKIARQKISSKKVKFIQSTIENLPNKIKSGSVDLVIMVRVLHHISDVEGAFSIINRILKNKGYFILEFANKRHFKATISEICKGNLTFPLDIFPKDIRCQKNIKRKTLPFFNYHPDDILQKLENEGFEVIEKVSVSNFRFSFFKKYLPKEFLLAIDSALRKIFSFFSFGPSIFVLLRKRDI